MLIRVDLRKPLRLGGAGGMAAHAEHRRVRLAGIDRWIVGVLGQWTVAGLAVHLRVFACAFGLGHIGVTGLAGLVSGKADGMSSDLADGGAAVVSVLAEAARHEKSSNNKKRQGPDSKQARKAEEMSCISKNAHDAIPLNAVAAEKKRRKPLRTIQKKQHNGCMCPRSHLSVTDQGMGRKLAPT